MCSCVLRFHCMGCSLVFKFHVFMCIALSLYAPRSLMIFANVDGLSSDEAPVPKAGVLKSARERKPRSFRIRKNKRKCDCCSSAQRLAEDPDLLLKRLSRACGCRRTTCCSQFTSGTNLLRYKDYLARWCSLAKLDQDQIATCRPVLIRQDMFGHAANQLFVEVQCSVHLRPLT